MSSKSANQDLKEIQTDDFGDRFLPLVEVIHEIVEGSKAPIIMALEGRCGSGKSTLSTFLRGKFDCNVIHMDDFFLPPNLRTNERLNEPGGNIHYERFIEEVIHPLKENSAFSYNAFQCSDGSSSRKELQPARLTIIEGVYSLHPKLQSIYDYKVFLTMSPKEQIRRLSKRNEKMLDKFINIWIPLEEKYYSTFQVEKYCDFIFNTETCSLTVNSETSVFKGDESN
ncbi:uridine kinase family protein [Ureibacillus manganicus]|uniref:uridine kinase family protein n=1 Tax=Ureibacillus manganicus TaxID=1266064 RepID=UPI00068B700C|nr:AAA family ATPase [Ureibacillus manganicus]